MSPETRARYKQLANDSIIATFGRGGTREQRLAEALEACVEWIDDIADKCAHCSNCEHHGDHADNPTVFTKI